MADVPSRASFLASIYGSMFISVDPPTVIDAALTSAALRTSSTIFSSNSVTEEAVFLRAAIMLLRHPKGFPMRQANPDQIYVWQEDLRDIQRTAAIGLRNC